MGPSEPGGPWSLDLVDTRGDLTLTLYSDATETMACLDSPSFVQIITVSGTGAPAVADNSATLDYLRIREASGDMYTVAMGRSGSAVSGVGLQRVDGSDVAATVGDGHFVAWWPEAEGVSTVLPALEFPDRADGAQIAGVGDMTADEAFPQARQGPAFDGCALPEQAYGALKAPAGCQNWPAPTRRTSSTNRRG